MKTLVFSSDDIGAIVRATGLDRLMDETIAGLEARLGSAASSSYRAPVRSGFHYSEPHPGLLEWMPAMEVGGKAVMKVVAYHPSNPGSRRVPSVISSATTFELGTGHLSTVMDATFATALRTGAASAVASRVLADPDAKVLGLVGCGAQSVSQLHAMSRIFDIERVLVYDIDPVAAESLRERADTFGMAEGVEWAVVAPETLVASCDILCTQTTVAVGEGPVVPDVEPRPHLHVNAVGSDFPGKRELPRSLLQRSLVCPDFREQAVCEGECQGLSPDWIGPDLRQLVRDAEAYREYRGRLTVFDSTGWALEDHVVLGILADRGRELGLGRYVQIESVAGDPSNPYEGLADPVPSGSTAGDATGVH